ncbi:MAG: hypothetical protein OSB41_06980, partial [Kiritimatiellae bacterium]|nr:hypothetical protein [Kiritimatiellia bacterium]
MMRHTMPMALLAAVIAAGSATAPADELDYYKGAVYPGASHRKDVERPTLTTQKAPPGEFAQREVTFWPRKGMDVVPIEKNMPLRTWTFQLVPGEDSIWGRKKGVPEAGQDPSYREEYWDSLSS